MSNSTKAGKKRIVFIGRHNVGKTSLVNAFLGKETSFVSESHKYIPDALEITMELPPYGSVVIVDTSPIEETAEQRQDQLNRAIDALSKADFVVVVLDAREKLNQTERGIFHQLKSLSIPFLVAVNKIEYGINSELINSLRALNAVHFEISCKEEVGIDSLKSRITRFFQSKPKQPVKN